MTAEQKKALKSRRLQMARKLSSHYHRELQADLLLKLLCIQKLAKFSLLKATLSKMTLQKQLRQLESKWLRLDLS